MTDTGLIACCGLYCGDCLRFNSRAAGLARELRAELDRVDFDKYVQVKKTVAPEFDEYPAWKRMLQAVIDLDCAAGCRAAGCPGLDCSIRACCLGRGLDGCWECDGLDDCPRFDFLTPFHGDLKQNNLRRLREAGPAAWLETRPPFYGWLKGVGG
jgi:hypothetical protein